MSVTSPALQRFCRLPNPSYEKVYADANTILDDIISQCHTFRTASHNSNAKELVSFMCHGCEILQNATILLRSKFSQVINIYLPHTKNSLTVDCLNKLVSFLCLSMTNNKSSLMAEFMKTLSATLLANGPMLDEENIGQLIGEDGILWFYFKQKDDVIKTYSIECLGNMCIRSSNGDLIEKSLIKMCYSKLLDYLRLLLLEETEDIEHLKVIVMTLKSLKSILGSLTVNDNIVEPVFAVSLLKIFLAYGNSDYRSIIDRLVKVLPTRNAEDLELVEKIYPTKMKEKSAMTKKVYAKKSRKKKKRSSAAQASLDDSFDSDETYGIQFRSTNWRQPAVVLSSSESDYSDTEGSRKEMHNSALMKIRLHAADVLQNVLRCCDKRAKFSCWLTLIPETISLTQPSLLYSLAMEHSPKIRPSVLLALMEVIDGSRGFLDSAVNNSRSSSSSLPYTPFSVKLNQSLQLAHDTLLIALEQAQTDLARDKVVKCLTLLVLNTPYKKLNVDYLPNIIVCVYPLIKSSEVSVCQSAFTCLAACISVNPENAHMRSLLRQSELPNKTDVVAATKQTSDIQETHSWLVDFCLKTLGAAAKDEAHDLRILAEVLQLLTVILRCHPQILRKEQCAKIVDLCINVFLFQNDQVVSLHSIKILEEFSKYFNAKALQTKNATEVENYWKKMVQGPIPQYLHVKPIKPAKGQAAICDFISNMGSQAFSAVKNSEQIFVKTVLIGMASSEEPVVAAAAVRALGVIIDFDAMKDDVWFVVDVSRLIISQLENPSVNVRLKAAWSLANLCDFISKNGYFVKEFPETMILKLLQCSTQASADNEKVSCNGVRSLGNILKNLPKKMFEKKDFEVEVNKAINVLIKNILSSPMKGRWNACYACKYMLENEDFPAGTASWSEKLYNALIEALRDCKNFKVRISAACALSSAQQRSCYGDQFNTIWRESLVALEKSQELTDFTEFKHKDTLQSQTTTLLLHMLSLASLADLKVMRQEVQSHGTTFLAHCERCVTTVEKSKQLDKHETSKQDEPTEAKTAANESCIERVRANLLKHLNIEESDKIDTLELITKSLFIMP